MKNRPNQIINNLEVALRTKAIKRLHLESILNGFVNCLGFDCIKYEHQEKGIKICIDVDHLSKIDGAYIAEVQTKETAKKERLYYSLNNFSVIDLLKNKNQKAIQL